MNYRAFHNFFFTTHYVSRKVIPLVPKKERFVIFPYLETMLSNLKWKLRTCFKNSLPKSNIKIILKSTNRLSSLLHLKDVIPKELQSHVLYKFSCDNCNVTHSGKTESHFNVNIYITFNRKKGRMQAICSFRSPFTA